MIDERSAPASFRRLARAVLLAEDAGEALRGWLQAVRPPADVALLAREQEPPAALRRAGEGWHPLPLPPATFDLRPEGPLAIDLGAASTSAMTDLLRSLGMRAALALPLEPESGALLLLARAGAPFGEAERRRLAERAAWLAPVLGAIARRERQEDATRRASREMASLVELNAALARASTLPELARACARMLAASLGTASGALRLALAPDRPGVAVAWPEGAEARALLARFAIDGDATEELPEGGAGGAAVLAWLRPDPPAAAPRGATIRIALGWRHAVPPSAARLVAAVQNSLALALARLQLQTRREESRLRETVEGLPLGVALMTRDGRLRLVNRAGRELLDNLGAWPGEGERLERLGPVELAPLLGEAATGRSPSVEILVPRGGRTIELRVVPAGAGVLAVFEDVTEDRRRRRQLAQAEKLSALGKLISGVVHEINNPLATVIGYAEMLAAEPGAEESGRWLALLRDEAERCQRIVRNMLSLAGNRSGGRELVAPGAVAERALSLVGYPFRVAGVEAHLTVDPETPAVEADPDALLQVLINLLTNALHALEDVEGPREVKVTVRPDGDGEVLLEVADTGPGIPPENLERIFDPFYTSKPEGKGTGLGLSLVAAAVREHGGRIDVRSAPGQGAAFQIHLPAAADREQEAAGGASEDATEAVLGGLEGRRVLVVDDEPSVAGLLVEILERAGARASRAENGREALERVLADPPDAVVADLRMPGLSGEALVRELDARAPALARRVVLTTGDLMSADGARTIERAGRPCLVKPFQVTAVVETVRDVIASAGGDGPSRR